MVTNLVGSDPDAVVVLAVDGGGFSHNQLVDDWHTDDREALAAMNANDGFTRPALTHTRCGRWAALLRAGAVIRALPVTEPAALASA